MPQRYIFVDDTEMTFEHGHAAALLADHASYLRKRQSNIRRYSTLNLLGVTADFARWG